MALFNYDKLSNIQINRQESYEYMKDNYLLRKAKDISLDNIRHKSFDIFLSHSYNDKEIIPALKKELEKMGYTVYVDWITDSLLSRDEVNSKTAEILQIRMNQSKCLVYATSDNSKKSRWMPWELGYFDGIKTKMVGILPIQKENNNFQDDFKGEEYLGLYFYITIDKLSKELLHTVMAMERNALQNMKEEMDKVTKLFIQNTNNKFVLFDEWLNGKQPYSIEDEMEEIMNKKIL